MLAQIDEGEHDAESTQACNYQSQYSSGSNGVLRSVARCAIDKRSIGEKVGHVWFEGKDAIRLVGKSIVRVKRVVPVIQCREVERLVGNVGRVASGVEFDYIAEVEAVHCGEWMWLL